MKRPHVNQEKCLKSTKPEVKGVKDNEQKLKGSSTFIAKGQKTIPKTFMEVQNLVLEGTRNSEKAATERRVCA